MEYLTTIKFILDIVVSTLIFIYACILIKIHFVNHKKVTNEQILLYLLLLSSRIL
jgi:hypothetical protein